MTRENKEETIVLLLFICEQLYHLDWIPDQCQRSNTTVKVKVAKDGPN